MNQTPIHETAASTGALPAATIVGYPRIGPDRELKKAEESYWAGRIDRAQFDDAVRELRRRTRARLVELGLSEVAAIPGTFSLYDQVLDAAVATGIVPARLAHVLEADGTVGLDGYFTLARGDAQQSPLEMPARFSTVGRSPRVASTCTASTPVARSEGSRAPIPP